ncbi:MAG: GH39 family glycosyl hydrolase [Bacteroidota bacterium]
MQRITIPAQPNGVFTNNWRFCVGTERMGIALQKEYLDTLAFVQNAVGFRHIRGHGLLHDDTGIYREYDFAGETRPFYNFTYLDRIFDSFLERGLRPFVELGFMPGQLASGDQTVFYWRGNVTPPKDYARWRSLIKAVVSHFVDRYGLDEVLNWPFEVWNEPNLDIFWQGADQAEYFKLYRETVSAVKEVHEGLRVGGPAICGGADRWIADFLEFCHRENVPVDFVTRHAYSSMQPSVRTPELVYQDLWPNTHILNEFKTVRGMISNSPFPDLPLHITEYNTSYSPINPVHDTPLNAAYLARVLSEGGDYADSFSYWTFSDVFEESDVPRAQFHGGFGLVALNGIPKPTFHLFSFFAKLGGERLYRDEHLLVTRRRDGSIAFMAWNEVMEKGGGHTREYELSLPVGHEEVFVKRQTVNEENGNPWRVWIQMGRPRFPGRAEVETLRQAAQPALRTDRLSCEHGLVKLRFTLTKNEISLFEITKITDESHTYLGLDDARIPGYS